MGSLWGEVMQKGGDNTKKEKMIFVLYRDGFGLKIIFEEVKWA